MKNTDFDSKRIAAGYAKRPWLHQHVMEQVKRDLKLTEPFQKGLDVGCGAGLSTKGLRLLCNQVTGTDISPAMIEVCKEIYQNDHSYDFYAAKAEETRIPDVPYDIVTAAGMVNWVDTEHFLQNMSQVLRNRGYLIIYDFWISDRMSGNQDYTEWYQNEYLKRYPKPPRKENIWTQQDLTKDFLMGKQISHEMSHEFTLEDFIDFMMIQSNVNAKVEKGEQTEEEVRKWMKQSLEPIFQNKKQAHIFEGYNWYIQKI